MEKAKAKTDFENWLLQWAVQNCISATWEKSTLLMIPATTAEKSLHHSEQSQMHRIVEP